MAEGVDPDVWDDVVRATLHAWLGRHFEPCNCGGANSRCAKHIEFLWRKRFKEDLVTLFVRSEPWLAKADRLRLRDMMVSGLEGRGYSYLLANTSSSKARVNFPDGSCHRVTGIALGIRRRGGSSASLQSGAAASVAASDSVAAAVAAAIGGGGGADLAKKTTSAGSSSEEITDIAEGDSALGSLDSTLGGPLAVGGPDALLGPGPHGEAEEGDDEDDDEEDMLMDEDAIDDALGLCRLRTPDLSSEGDK